MGKFGRWIAKRLGRFNPFRSHAKQTSSAWPEVALFEMAKKEFNEAKKTYTSLICDLYMSEHRDDSNLALKYHAEAIGIIHGGIFGAEDHYVLEDYTRALNEIIADLKRDKEACVV